MLLKRGYAPFVAVDGMEGVAMAEEHRPQLVLMDLQMPHMDGFAAAAEIRRRLGVGGPPIIAVTANAADDVRAACSLAGFACVLSKPITFEELIDMVRRHLGAPRPAEAPADHAATDSMSSIIKKA